MTVTASFKQSMNWYKLQSFDDLKSIMQCIVDNYEIAIVVVEVVNNCIGKIFEVEFSQNIKFPFIF